MTSAVCMVLRKTPFQESSLIIACVGPTCGRIDFLMKGASAIGRKKFPLAGLFRELSLQFREPRDGSSSLICPSCAELSASFDGIASFPESYLAACSHASFLLKNSKPMLECQQSYDSFKRALAMLCAGEPPLPWLSLAKLAFLHESGFLSDFSAGSPQKRAAIEGLLKCALSGGPLPPDMTPERWARFSLWLDVVCREHLLS